MTSAFPPLTLCSILFSQWIVSVHSTENVALLKPAWQSSTHTSAASKSVDGNRNPNYYSLSCSHTENAPTNDYNPWWIVDLGAYYVISHVIVASRGDCCSYQLNNFTIDVSLAMASQTDLSGFASRCSHYPWIATAAQIINLPCEGTTIGRYVKLQKIGEWTHPLVMCEVEVYGEPITCFGPGHYRKIKNMKSPGQPSLIFTARSLLHCSVECTKQMQTCKSFNFNKTTLECQHIPSIDDTVAVEGWSFHTPC